MDLKDEKLVIIIPKYARTYGKAAPKFYTQQKGKSGVFSRTGKFQKDIPKRVINNPHYTWKLRGAKKIPTLFDVVNREWVVANPKEVLTGHQIKAQETNINNRMHDGIRNKVFAAIKNSCKPYLRHFNAIPKEWYPVRVDIALHDTVANPFDDRDPINQVWDVDNLCSVYQKSVLDLLVNRGLIEDESLGRTAKGNIKKRKGIIDKTIPCILEDDDRFYVSLPLCYWRPLKEENHDKRYIQITIRPDLQARENELFKKFHNRLPLKPSINQPQGKLFKL